MPDTAKSSEEDGVSSVSKSGSSGRFPLLFNLKNLLLNKRKFPFRAFILTIILIIPVLIFIYINIFRTSDEQKDDKSGTKIFSGWDKLVIPQKQTPFFTVTTNFERKFGILPDEKLVLKTKEQVDQKFIENNLESSVGVIVNSINPNTYEIRPASGIGLDKLVLLKLKVGGKDNRSNFFDRDYSWAFQTQGKFRVVSSIPGDKKVDVPLNTGFELVFSQDDYKDPTGYISISPRIKFRTERQGPTFIIVPIDSLEEKTVYTVVLRKGLNLDSRNDPISEDYQFSFQTMEKQKKRMSFNTEDNFYQTAPGKKFQTRVFTANWTKGTTIKTDVYRFTGSEEFIKSREKLDEIQSQWMNYHYEKDKVSVLGMDKVMSVDLEVMNSENINYIQFPDLLSKGFYIAEMSYGYEGQTEQIWIQSTEITGYVSVGKEQTVVWSNRSKGEPVVSALVKLVGSNQESRTSEQGIAIFTTPESLFGEKRKYLSITRGNDEVYLKINNQENRPGPGKETAEDYWSYFYHERWIYKTTDKIDFFAVVKNRRSNLPPSSVTAEFHRGYRYKWVEENDDSQAIFVQTVTPSNDGSFTGSFNYSDLPEGVYHVKLLVNGVEIISGLFDVRDFKKPEMKIEVTGDKKAIFTDEKVDFLINTRFFDDTPVANTPVSIHESSGAKSTTVKTDGSGQTKYEYETKYKGNNSYYPMYEYISVIPAISQEQDVEGFGTVYVFGSRLMIRSESSQAGNNGKFTAKVRNVDLSGINSGVTNEYEGKPAVNWEVKLSLSKSWYEKIEKGTYYDFIEKTTRKSYDYKYHRQEIDSRSLTTNEIGEIAYEFPMEQGKSYEIKAEVTDKDGHTAETKSYYFGLGLKQEASEIQKSPLLSIGKDENTFSKGETVNVNIELNGESYPDNDKNRFLFLTVKNGLQEAVVKQSPRYSFDFENKHIPNVYLGAVIYTGDYYQRAAVKCRYDWYCTYELNNDDFFNGFNILYKQEDSKADIVIDSSESSKAPGGKARIIVRALQNGQPLVNASMNIALVDQALAAIGGAVKPSILQDLYRFTSHYIYYNYGTHEPILPEEPQAEMGGGGGEDRSLFKDSAYFGLSRTDASGTAVFEFDLPDNITTWNIYAQAIDGQMNAGWDESKLTVTKDFFVTSQFPGQFLLSDKAGLTGGSYGTALNLTDYVNYESLFFQGESELDRYQKTESAFKSVNFDFPKLTVGKYDAVLRGKVRDRDDGIRLPFEVLLSRFNSESYTHKTLNKGNVLSSAGVSSVFERKPVVLIISDVGKGAYYKTFRNFCYTSSNRLEKQLAGILASGILERTYSDKCEKTYEGINLFQAEDGGLSQVSWGASNLETTAWAVNIDVKPFDSKALEKYFETVLNNSKSGIKEKIYALWGLTELGKPQIFKLDILRQQATGFEEKVILAIAYVSVGDTEKALDLYYEILAEYAYQSGPYISIQSPGEQENTKNIVSTSHTLLLSEMTDKDYSEGMAKYIRDFRERAQHLVIDLSEIAYYESQLSKLPEEDTRIRFKSSSIEEFQDLTKGRSIKYEIAPQDINKFNLEVINGKAECYISYYLDVNSFSKLPRDDKLKISRIIESVDGKDRIQAGGIVRVRIDFDVDHEVSPPGKYIIRDYLPSGLKYISNPRLLGLESEGWVSHNSQEIEYSFYNSDWWRTKGKKYLIYYARAGSVGIYNAEQAVIQSQNDLKIFNSTDMQAVTINSSNN